MPADGSQFSITIEDAGASTASSKRTRGRRPKAEVSASAPPTSGELTTKQLETWLWKAACAIRGTNDAPKFKDFILPLLFFKRLSDVFDDEFAGHITAFGDDATARAVVEADHTQAVRDGRRPMVRFYIPQACGWCAARHHDEAASGKGLGEFVTDCLKQTADLNPELKGVLSRTSTRSRPASGRSTTIASGANRSALEAPARAGRRAAGRARARL